ncbi:MAG TPA: trypsin-like peptidase domain-containing protein [Acidimicrobiales bacterium]|nr:trypsin-like peptidase domain-containing protein [Acidimicrobiales bacterium]
MTPTPEEPADGGPDDERPDSAGDEADAPLRGWIDPDDRLWRHPSEVARGSAAALAAPRAGTSHHPRVPLLIGAAAVLAAVAWGIILLSPASDRPSPNQNPGAQTDSPDSILTGQDNAIPTTADAAGRSMVQLRASTSHGSIDMVGVAVAEGGLVATTADGLVGLRSLSMVGANGRLQRASVVAIDRGSDLALVNVPDDLPVAPFSDDDALASGSNVMTLSMVAPSSSSTTLVCTPGSVTALGGAIDRGPAAGMPGIVSSAAGVATEAGDPLLNSAGSVIGILYDDDDSATTADDDAAPTYLPTQLVLGVADDLRSSGRVAHGWLGVQGSEAAASGGAVVADVMTGSPAVGRLQPGEVIVSMGSLPIRSMAELRSRLYVLPPATTVKLSVLSGGTTRVVDVTLSASP